MMNNEDLYGTVNVRAMSKLSLRSEGHTLRLASASDLWYSGGGAFEPRRPLDIPAAPARQSVAGERLGSQR
jgi:hypothetical protein